MDFQIELGEQNDWHSLPEQSPPDIERDGLLHGRMPTSAQACVIMSPQALQAVDVHLLSDTRKELGGFLLGTSYQEDGRLYVEIEAAVVAHSDKNGPVHFTFTADSWALAHQEREAFYPDLHIVGWFHSHPDLGVFYSADDVTVHTTAFSSLWHVGLVVDPIRREACVFGWEVAADGRPEDIIPLKGFVEMAPDSDESMIDWHWTHGTGLADLQRKAYTTGMRRVVGMDSRQYGPAAEPVDIVGAMMRVSAITFAMTAALFLLIWFPMRQRTQDLETAVYLFSDQQRAALHEDGLIYCPDSDLIILSPAPDTVVRRNRRLDVIGTATDANARYYELQVRPADQRFRQPEWVMVDRIRFDTVGGVIGSWDPRSFYGGDYQLRLVAVYRNGLQTRNVISSTACEIAISLPSHPVPVPAPTPESSLPPYLDPSAGLPQVVAPDILPKSDDE